MACAKDSGFCGAPICFLAAAEAAEIFNETLLKAPVLISQAREILKELDAGRLDVAKSMTASISIKWGIVGAVAGDIFVGLWPNFCRRNLLNAIDKVSPQLVSAPSNLTALFPPLLSRDTSE